MTLYILGANNPDVSSRVLCSSLLGLSWLFRSHECHDSFWCVAWVICTCDMTHSYACHELFVQPIADRAAKNLENISKNFQLSIRRTRIFMGYIISTMLLHGTNRESHGQNSGSLKSFGNDVKNFCHPICNRLYVQHDSLIRVLWFIYMYDMTYSNVWYDYAVCTITPCDSFTTSHLHTHTHTHTYTHAHTHTRTCTRTHTQFTCTRRHLSWCACTSCGMTHSYVWLDPSKCVTCLLYICDMTQSHVWREEFTCVAWLFTCVTRLIQMSAIIHP